MPFSLSDQSLLRLDGVHADLVSVVKLAIGYSDIDFSVLEAVRSYERQVELFNTGASTTMDSRHLTGHAVDLGAYVGGVRWEPALYFPIAIAMRKASQELDVPVFWGGCWKELTHIENPAVAVALYAQKKLQSNQSPFLDYPHFQLPRSVYK